MRSLIIGLLPGSIREQILSRASVGQSVNVADMVFWAAIESGQGALKDKTATLESLTSPKEASNPREAVRMLRTWRLLLERATKLQASIPDATLLIRSLTIMCGRAISSNYQTNFRKELFMNKHNLPHGASTEHVFLLYNFLEAELLELSGPQDSEKSKGKASTAVVTPQKGKKGSDSKGKGKAKTNPKGGKDDPKGRKVCDFFDKPGGCKNGQMCKYYHKYLDPKSGRCFVCGSNEHSASGCTRPRRQKDGNEKAKGGKGGKDSPVAKVIKVEEDSPLARPEAKISVVRATTSNKKGWALLDSGASHHVRDALPGEQCSNYRENCDGVGNRTRQSVYDPR